VDGRADQFALGVVVYRMLTGSTLYGDHTIATMAYKIVNEPAASVRSRNSSLPAAVDAVVAKALAKAPDARYRNCTEFGEALARALAGETQAVPIEDPVEVPTRATVAPPPQPPRKSGNYTAAGAIVLALVAGGVAGVIWWKPWIRPVQPTDTAVVVSRPPAESTAPPSDTGLPKSARSEPVRKAMAPVEKSAENSSAKQPQLAAETQPADEIQPDTQAPPADTPKPATEALNRGRDLMKQRQFAEAVQAFTKAADIRPNWGLGYVNRGSAYQHMGQFDSALRDYSRAISLNPKLVNAWVGRAQCYVELKQDNPAFDDFNQAIALKPDDAVALHGRAWIYLRRKAYHKSLADFNESIRLSPDNVPAYRGRAAARRGLGDLQGAQADQVKYEELSAKKGG
jgi:tetratricopeptide (TPR) repeat protein